MLSMEELYWREEGGGGRGGREREEEEVVGVGDLFKERWVESETMLGREGRRETCWGFGEEG